MLAVPSIVKKKKTAKKINKLFVGLTFKKIQVYPSIKLKVD